MRSKSPEQARLMRAVAHGFKPTRIKSGGPSVAVAKDFVSADEERTGRVKGMTQANSGGLAGRGYRIHTASRRDIGGNGSAYSMNRRGAK